MKTGKVYLVGAGPGDVGLITVKGLTCIKKADVIIYDHLLDERIMESARPGVERIYVGKTASHHIKKQHEINQLLVDKAREGKVVVRLKGGDPFVLGRGGEEAEALAQNHILFEMVPGVSSSVAVPAYAGIPVTHRHMASSFAVITGHEDPSKAYPSVNWDKLSTSTDTLVFLMGVANLSRIVERLISNGRPPSTPVALIKNGTMPQQASIIGTLSSIVARAESVSFSPPAVIVVGEVVGMRERLRWFDNRPLFGKRVLVTRARSQAGNLSRLLLEYGAQPVEMPAIEIKDIPDTKELDQAISNIEAYQWLVFTSVNGVDAFFKRLYALGYDARALKGLKLGVIGTATAEALEDRGLRSDYIPQEFTSRGFVDGLKGQDVRGRRFLLPRTDIAPKELVDEITGLGAEVHDIVAYKTVPATEAIAQGEQMLASGEIDIITFTSSSTVTNLLSLINGKKELLNGATLACIGPVTAATAAKAGLKVDIVAPTHTISGLLEALEEHFQEDGKEAK